MAAARVVIGSSCTIQDAATLKGQLLEALGSPGPVELDAGSVERVDTAGLQLLVGFALDCLERNLHFGWSARSSVFDEAADLIAVSALLESPGGAPIVPGMI